MDKHAWHKASWKVLVATQALSVGRRNIRSGKRKCFVKRIVRPNTPLIAGTAAVGYQALYKINHVRPINDAENRIAKRARVWAEHVDRDGVASNDLLITQRFAKRPRLAECNVASDMLCGNHRVSLTDSSILECYEIKTIHGAIHRYGLLMRMGSNFTRCSLSIPSVVTKIVQPGTLCPPPPTSEYNLEVFAGLRRRSLREIGQHKYIYLYMYIVKLKH